MRCDRPFTLRDVPDGKINIDCDACNRHGLYVADRVAAQYTHDLLLIVWVDMVTKGCSRRAMYHEGDKCAARCMQLDSLNAAREMQGPSLPPDQWQGEALYSNRRSNFQGDHFTHAIDVVDDTGKTKEHVAGANNVAVANIAFDELLYHHNPPEVLMLRDGARVMRQEKAKGGGKERYMQTASRRKTQ